MNDPKYQEAPVEPDQPVEEHIDTATGEVLREDEPTPPATPIRQVERAADGAVLAPPSRSAGTLLDLLEDGDFSLEAYQELKELGEALQLHSANGQKAKGKATITLDFEQEGEAMRVRADIKVKKPELPRRQSIVWQTDEGDFTRFPPRQVQMFGGRTPRVIG